MGERPSGTLNAGVMPHFERVVALLDPKISHFPGRSNSLARSGLDSGQPLTNGAATESDELEKSCKPCDELHVCGWPIKIRSYALSDKPAQPCSRPIRAIQRAITDSF